MQLFSVGMMLSVWVALTMRMTTSCTPIFSAVSAVLNPVRSSSPSGVTKVMPTEAHLSMCAL